MSAVVLLVNCLKVGFVIKTRSDENVFITFCGIDGFGAVGKHEGGRLEKWKRINEIGIEGKS
jgi:hypothetical protein